MSVGESSTQGKNAEVYEEEDKGLTSKLLHPPSLDHTNPFLSPSSSLNFDVDEFLLSRAPGSTLKEIFSELQSYNAELKNQLSVVVDRDFKGFVSLGAALKAEGPRIARLDWKVASSSSYQTSNDEEENGVTRRAGDDEWNQKQDTPRGSGGNLGLDKVRSEVVSVRDHLRKAEEEVRDVIRSKEEAEIQKANLMMVLSLNDSLKRLESLLVVPSEEEEEEDEGSSEEEFANDQTAKYWQAFSKVQEFNEDSESDLDSSGGEQTSDAKHQQNTMQPNVGNRRASYKSQRPGLMSARRRSSYGTHDIAEKAVDALATRLNLPARVARASSEHAALLFLRDRATQIGFTAYVAAHEARWTRVRELLKDDLRKLITILTRYEGSSLLVDNSAGKGKEKNPYRDVERMQLETWSPNASSAEERRVEQIAWFESALNTWCELPATDPEKSVNGAKEAEEAIRGALISSWAEKTITVDALTIKSPDPKTPKTPKTPFGHGQEPYFSRHPTEEPRIDGQVPLIPQDIVEYSEDDAQAQALIRLYNDILFFVSTISSGVYQAAERVVARRGPNSVSTPIPSSKDTQIHPGHCDIFVRVVWEEIATRLMEQLGGQLFFAGRPDVFHRNYTISMAFLSAFESLAPSQRAREALHQHASYLTFRKRWQLPVYFQIRLRDSITRLEKALTSSSGSRFGFINVEQQSQQRLPLMTATSEALALFTMPWKRGMHVMDLANRQWRLSLQVLARYKNWIEEELPSDIVLANRRAFESVKGSGARSSHDISRTASPSRAGTPTGTESESDDSVLASFTVIAADLIWLGRQVMDSFEKDIVPILAGKTGSEAIIESMRQTLQESLSTQSRIVPILSTRITLILKSRCAEPLRLVRSVSTQYRVQPLGGSNQSHASNGSTSEPSSFVVQFLRPIRIYLGKGEGKVEQRRIEATSRFLDRSTRSQWMSEVVEDFVSRYSASLGTMNKNYESLRRLKRGNTGPSGASTMGFGSLFNRNSNNQSAGANAKVEEDLEAKRMHNQMTIDVEWLEKEVQDLITVDTDVETDTAGWKRLKAAAAGQQDDG